MACWLSGEPVKATPDNPMKNTSLQHSRKAFDRTETSASASHELIKLGVDTHGGQYTFARMIDHLGAQPPQKLSPEAFVAFCKKQLSLARRVVMEINHG